MGAGSSVHNGDIGGGVGSREYAVPLRNLEDHLTLFQHTESGETLVLLEHDMSDLPFVTKDELTKWMEVSLSSREGDYFRTIQKKVLNGEESSSLMD
jgi:hypothetical protein